MPFTSQEKTQQRSPFVFIGENPALDFVNTLVIDEGRTRDLLASWPDVVEWLTQAKLSSNASLALPPASGRDALPAVIELRRAWEKTLSQLVAGKTVSDAFLDQINTLLSHDTFHEHLHREGKKGFHLTRSPSQLEGGKLALAILARQIANFLAGANLDHLHRCANLTSCVLYFYDTTKNHRRQWCSVATCGNRHKVAQFRKRQARAKK